MSVLSLVPVMVFFIIFQRYLVEGIAMELKEQTEWYQTLCAQAAANYERYMRECEAGDALVSDDGRTLYRDTLMLQAQIHCECFEGAEEVCRSILAGLSGDYRRAFYYAGSGEALPCGGCGNACPRTRKVAELL